MFIDRWHEVVEPRLEEASLPPTALQSLCIHCANHALNIAEVHYWTDTPSSSWATLRQIIQSYQKWIDEGRPKDVAPLRTLMRNLLNELEDDEEDRPSTWSQMADGLHHALELVLGDTEDRGEFVLAAGSLHHSFEALQQAEISQNMIPIAPPGAAEDVAASLMSMTPGSVESSEFLTREIDFQLACIERLQAEASLGDDSDPV